MKRAALIGAGIGSVVGLIVGLRAALIELAMHRWVRELDRWREQLYRDGPEAAGLPPPFDAHDLQGPQR